MPHASLFSLIALSLSIGAQPLASTPAAAPAETIATAQDIAKRMTVPTQINGHGPFAFTIDTGADRSVVSDQLAEQLGLPANGQVTMHGIIGPQQIGTVRVDRLRVGVNERRAISAPVLPQAALGARGFLGVDAMAGQSVILDFKHNRITLGPSRPDDEEPGTIVVVGRTRFGQLILTDARVNGVKVYAIIDTGAENTIGNLALRRLLGRDGAIREGMGRLIGVTGVELPAEPSSVPRITLGGMTLAHMPIAYADVHSFRQFGVDKTPSILVGMDVLRQFQRVAVDFRRRQVRFLIGDGALSRS